MTFDAELERAFDTLSDRLRDELDRQVRAAMDELSASARREADSAAAAAIAALPPPAVPPPIVERVVVEDTSAVERLADGMRAIDQARTLTGVLDALLAATAHDDIAAGIWLLRGGRLRRWRSTGMEMPADEIALGGEQPAHRAVVDAARTNSPSMHDGFAVPLAISGEVVAVLWVVDRTGPDAERPALNPQTIEPLARLAARCLESITAFKTARAMAERAGNMPSVSAPTHAAAAPTGDLTTSEEHEAARRYARLLVSEIRLYHEQAVLDGRRDRDLATRLGGEIAHARVMYEQRVPPQIREQSDHFHDELVRTLADGDASLLEMRT